jgi:starch synthase
MQFRPDIIHCHDWQTGLIPMYLKVLLKSDAFFQHTASVFTIHNIAYQGIFPKTLMEVTGFSWNEFRMDQFEYYDQISFMKAALMNANQLTTVSPTYAQEIQNSYEFGQGMEGVLRNRSSTLTGILNGLDQDDWNPAKDPFLAETFDADHLAARRESKTALQKSLKFTVDPSIPMLGMVARIDRQKGMDLLTQILPELMNRRNVQITVLGQGDEDLMRELERDARQYPGHVRICTDFNEPLAHHIYGGSDLFLMPSRFEPCGLSQMIAMRYGSIPVVANTGGLHDTVIQAGSTSGTGFLFQNGSAPAFLGAIEQALAMFRNTEAWAALQQRAMNEDFSWTSSVSAYLAVYRQALGRRSKSIGRRPSKSPKTR